MSVFCIIKKKIFNLFKFSCVVKNVPERTGTMKSEKKKSPLPMTSWMFKSRFFHDLYFETSM